jgi:hypothetical protein
MIERERSYRGISLRAAIHYLETVGGEQVDDATVVGEGWRASVSAETVPIGPSLELTEVTVVFESDDPERLDPLVERFSQKAIRAGG